MLRIAPISSDRAAAVKKSYAPKSSMYVPLRSTGIKIANVAKKNVLNKQKAQKSLVLVEKKLPVW